MIFSIFAPYAVILSAICFAATLRYCDAMIAAAYAAAMFSAA